MPTLPNPNRHSVRTIFVPCVILLCCSSPVAPSVEGAWGNGEVSLVLAVDGGRLTYPCGRGTIAVGWSLAPDGTFRGHGDHYFGGGPDPDSGRPPHPTNYAGLLANDHLTLTVLVDNNVMLGPFDLRRGGPEGLESCD
jgi:hypothetical protein